MRVELSGTTWDHPRGSGGAAAASAEYSRHQPGVGVRWSTRSLQAFADEPLEGLVSRHDLLVIDHPHVALAAHEGLLLPLDGRGRDAELAELAAHSVGRSHDSYRSRGRQLALAVDAAAQVAVHRADLLPRPPRTWTEVLELAARGRVLWPGGPIDAYSSLLTLAAAADRAPGSGPDTFPSARALAGALGQLRELVALLPPEALSMDPVNVAESMATSDRWWYCPLLFGYTNYARTGFRQHRLTYTDMPDVHRGGSLLGGAGIAVSARTDHPDEAVDVAFWLASAAVQRGPWFDGGGQPGHAAAWDDPRLDAATAGFFTGTRTTLQTAWTRPKHPGYLAVQDELSPLVTGHLAGRLGEEALLTVVRRAVARMEREGSDAGR